jgi:general secretion pathway protein J
MIAGLAQGIHFGITAWNIGYRATDAHSDFDAVDRTLRRLIENMDPGNDTDPAPFAASPEGLALRTALPDPAAPGSAQRVEATLAVARDHRLVLRWRPYLHVNRLRPARPATETELLRNVQRMDVTFWRAGGGWTRVWRSPDLPAVVRIHLTLRAGDPRHWPDIVAAPVLDRP